MAVFSKKIAAIQKVGHGTLCSEGNDGECRGQAVRRFASDWCFRGVSGCRVGIFSGAVDLQGSCSAKKNAMRVGPIKLYQGAIACLVLGNENKLVRVEHGAGELC